MKREREYKERSWIRDRRKKEKIKRMEKKRKEKKRKEKKRKEKKRNEKKRKEKKRKEKNEQTKEKAPLFKIYSVLRFDRGLDNHSYSYLVSVAHASDFSL